MKGLILAGGSGTRLRPLTLLTNKHLLPVYDKLMIEYPIQTLKDFGCDEIIIVSGGDNIGGFAEYLGDGSGTFGVKFTYRVQKLANGVAGALLCAEGLVDGLFPVILGDNYFEKTPCKFDKPSIYLSKVSDPQRFGVYMDGEIIEKPTEPKSNDAVVGFYVYDQRVFDYIKTLSPSARGELEITAVNNWYIKQGCNVAEHVGLWRDMGTFDTLFEVSERIKNKSKGL